MSIQNEIKMYNMSACEAFSLNEDNDKEKSNFCIY